MKMEKGEIREFLDEKYNTYHSAKFIETDPIQIPHLFSRKEDIEIAGFLAASIAWGQRKTIINNASRLMQMMDSAPFDFVMNSEPRDLANLQFVHRTFQSADLQFFITSLRNIYQNRGGLEQVFTEAYVKNHSVFEALQNFRQVFFEIEHPQRTEKHVSNVAKGSSGKRLNMFLRWMVRKSMGNVDFGLWRKIVAKDLYLPLDVHTGNVARKLGLLQRKQNDWRAVEEVTRTLREFDGEDPVKYDFALFGLGVFEGF